jgi:hypothetical protein
MFYGSSYPSAGGRSGGASVMSGGGGGGYGYSGTGAEIRGAMGNDSIFSILAQRARAQDAANSAANYFGGSQGGGPETYNTRESPSSYGSYDAEGNLTVTPAPGKKRVVNPWSGNVSYQ